MQEGALHLYFEEKIDTPKEEKHRTLIAHGFHKEIVVQDFPLRGKSVYLHIKRRRWLDKATGQADGQRGGAGLGLRDLRLGGPGVGEKVSH